jgi:glutathione synthase/RimK-type ligase-like ATP-grasp enzyme
MLKTNAMIQSTLVRKHIPLTRWFNQETLSDMMKLHHTVFIKPDKGSGGHGIIRVRKTSENLFEVIMGTRRLLVPQKNLMQYIQNFTRPFRSYLVQQGVKLAQYRGRPFDFRIYMQKPRNSWVVSGKVTRVAAPGRFLTNYHQGAKPATVPEVLRSVLINDRKVAEMIPINCPWRLRGY